MTAVGRQTGLIPVRIVDGRIEILLVTSLDTGRWVIPKGNVGPRLTPALAAIREGYEEAGVMGTLLSDNPVGSYEYLKRLANGRITQMTVDVFPFLVERQHRKWPEKKKRRLKWFRAADAAILVDEPGLSELLLSAEDELVKKAAGLE